MPAPGRFSRFADWKRNLLDRHQLQRADGRALYLYRLTEDEFNELESLLREWLARLLHSYDLGSVANLSGFSALFVLYGAEWWRRRYDGAGFSWEPILADLGADPDKWTPSQRSECVRLGLRDWGLQPRESGALRFLGTVAVQGGLPLRLLAEARGGIGQVIRRVLQLARGGQVTQADLLGWVESLANILPKSYRQAAIFTLLSDVAWTVLVLKEEAQLTPGTDAIVILDSKIPQWRDRFPLSVEDDAARSLIEQLVRDAASLRSERLPLFLPLERMLETPHNGSWTLRSSIELPGSIQEVQLAKIFNISTEDLPRTAELSLSAGDRIQQTTLRRLAGHNSYRIERKPWGFFGVYAAYEHVIRLTAPDGRVWAITATRGDALDEDLPWVFDPDDLSRRLLRQGGGSVAPIDAILVLPTDWHVSPEPGAEAVEQGSLESPERRVLRIRGPIWAQDNSGLSCRIRTGNASATEDRYEWQGDRYWLDFQKPDIAFKGLPSLYRVDQDGARRKVEGDPSCCTIGDPTGRQTLGPVILRYPATGEIKHQTRMLLLPHDAQLTMEFQDATSGVIRFDGWRICHARTVDPLVEHTCLIDGENLTLQLATSAGSRTPDRVEIDVLWPHTTTPGRLIVPFPAKGVRAFDGEGHELQRGALLAVRQLLGTRLLALVGQQNTHITLELSASNGRAMRSHHLRVLPGAISLELRLQDHATDIQHLLSIDDRPDSRVSIVLRIGGGERFRLLVARYAATLHRAGDRVYLEAAGMQAIVPEMLATLSVLAVRLEHPGDEAISLPPCSSEGVASGAWYFSPESREPGCWLIFPGPLSPLPFRPTLWPVAGDVRSESALARAIGNANMAERESTMDKVISIMAANFLDPCWVEVEQLAGQTGHLPLATLDIWRRFARSPGGMAALALRFGNLPNGFVDRFAQELPFAWETLSFPVWKRAMAGLKQQCEGSFGDGGGAYIFSTHLDSRIKDLTAASGALAYLLGIASVDFMPDSAREVQVLRFMGRNAVNRLFVGEDSLMMVLRRAHVDDPWPTESIAIIAPARAHANVAQFLYPQELGYPDGVINMPLLLAAQAASNETSDWFSEPENIHIMRACRAFDADWFDEAYNQTIARCLAVDLLHC